MPDTLIELFAEVLEVEAVTLSDESSPDTVEQWDSLASMLLVTEIEKKYDVQLSTREIMKMMSIGLARSALRGRGVDV